MSNISKLLTGVVLFVLLFGTFSPSMMNASFAQTPNPTSTLGKPTQGIIKENEGTTNQTVPNVAIHPGPRSTGDFIHETDFVNPDHSPLKCQSGIGVGIAFDGQNLWLSCYNSTPDLYKADPLTGVVSASFNIQGGIGALAYDSVNNVLYAGPAPGFQIIKITLDSNQNVASHQVLINNVPNDFSIDDGLAYDGADHTLYYSPDVSTTITHYDLSGNILDSFPWAGGNNCYNSGLAIGGNDLYEGSDGCNHVWVVDKVTKAPVFDFPTAGSINPIRDEDLECDPVTFADIGREVMWSVEAFDGNDGRAPSPDTPRHAGAYEVPAGTCGQGGAAAPTPGSIQGIKINETDGDGILNNGETTVPGVSICLDDVNAQLVVVKSDGCMPTDNAGSYNFTGLLPGFYKVSEVTPPGTVQTFPHNSKPYYINLHRAQNVANVNFGNTPNNPGSISGIKFNDTDTNHIWDSQNETGIAGVIIHLLETTSQTQTDANGNYSFTNLSPGDYTVYESLPPGTINTTPMSQVVHVGSGQNVTNVNFGNTLAVPPPPEVHIKNQVSSADGLPVVFFGTGQTFTKDVTDNCGGADPAAVDLQLTFSDTNGFRHKLMTQEDSSKIWTVTFDPFVNPGDGSAHLDHGTMSMKFVIDCSPATPGFPNSLDGDDQLQIGGMILVDPSGTIVDVNHNPIEGATVSVLKESPPDTGNYILPFANETSPSTNPIITGPNGTYGWEVVPGKWIVSASKVGFATNSSQPVVIPPAVTNLNVTLSVQTYCGKFANQFDNIVLDNMGNQILVGTTGDDLILGNGGTDSIFGKAGNDCIIAGEGRNYISGGDGNDTITVGNGTNKIWGGTGNDVITTGSGNNRIVGGPSIGPQGDVITVGTGNNLIWAGPGPVAHTNIEGGGGFNKCIAYSPDTGSFVACNMIWVR